MKEHLTEDDYGGIYYDERQRIDIFLVNNKWKDLLEKQGFQCIESDYPITEQNSDINKLWRESNGLCIENIEKNVVETDGKKVQLMILGRVEKEVSGIDLEQKNWEYIEGICAPTRMSGRGREKLCVYFRCPYRKPTQVDRKRILRPTGEG